MSTPWTSVTALYGWRSAGVPRGASIVTHSWSLSTAGSPPHHVASPRDVERQYANRRTSGAAWLHHGSSTPFHIAIAARPAVSASSSEITRCNSASCAEPGVARLTVLRLIHVYAPRAAAVRFSTFASSMSAVVHGVVAGPTFRTLTPAPTTSAIASVP